MKEHISNYIIDICNALNEVLQGKGLDHIYSYFPAVSATFIQQYLFKIINWFKSWKVHLLGINTLYRMGNGVTIDLNGNISSGDGDDFVVKILYGKESKLDLNKYFKDTFIKDTVKINPDGLSPSGEPYDLDGHNSVNDSLRLLHRIRVISQTGNKIEFTDNLRNMHLILNDPSTNVTVDESGLTIKTINGDSFSTVDGNKMVMTTDETPEDLYLSQILDEINLMSGDYITNSREDDDSE